MPPDQDQFAAALKSIHRADAEAAAAFAAWRAALPASISRAGSADERERLEAALRLAFKAGLSAVTVAAPIEQSDLIAQVLLEVRDLRRLVLRETAGDLPPQEVASRPATPGGRWADCSVVGGVMMEWVPPAGVPDAAPPYLPARPCGSRPGCWVTLLSSGPIRIGWRPHGALPATA